MALNSAWVTIGLKLDVASANWPLTNLKTYRFWSDLPRPTARNVCNPELVPVAAIRPRSNANEFWLNPVDLNA